MGTRSRPLDTPQDPSSASPRSDFVRPSRIIQVPSFSQNGTLSLIENLLESIVDAISNGEELVIPYASVRSLQDGAVQSSNRRDARPVDYVRFPGRTVQEVKKFGTIVSKAGVLSCSHRCLFAEALFRIIELSHEALLSGHLITKR
jgi:meiotic recombination protein SPO11